MLAILLAAITATSAAAAPALEKGWICRFTNQVREAHRSDGLEKFLRDGPHFDGAPGAYRIAYEDDTALVMTWAQPWNDGGVHSETIAISKKNRSGTEAYTDTARPEEPMIAHGECVPF